MSSNNSNYLKKNYHTHTPRCNHAKGSERDFIETAIKMGIEVLGFSDHAPMPYPGGRFYRSGVRMSLSETEGYVNTLKELREEYKDQIKILIGYEAEYFPDCFNAFIEHISQYECDYLILGQHFTHNEYDGKYIGRECDKEDLRIYIDQATKGLETGKFAYLAHPDVPRYVGDKAYYRDAMSEICILAKEKDIPLEINLYGIGTERNYPCDEFFEIAAEHGNKVIHGIDIHFEFQITEIDVYKKAEEFRKRLGLELTDEIKLGLVK